MLNLIQLLFTNIISTLLVCLGPPIILAIYLWHRHNKLHMQDSQGSRSDKSNKTTSKVVNVAENVTKVKDIPIDSKSNRAKFDSAYSVFKTLGFKLNEGILVDDIYNKDHNYSNKAFETIYDQFGYYLDGREPLYKPISNKCWLMHHKFIEDENSYNEIMENFSRITNGEITFEDIEVLCDERDNWHLTFSCNNKKYSWDFEVNRKWIDIKFFYNFQLLTDELNLSKRYTWYESGI